MKLLTIELHQEVTTLIDSKLNKHQHWFFDIAFQLDLEEVIAFQVSGLKLPDFGINSKGVASLKSIGQVNCYPGETRSKDIEKIEAYSLLSERFDDLQKQIDSTSEHALLDVYNKCEKSVNTYLDRMARLNDDIKELKEEYLDYRDRIAKALSLREQLTDVQVQGLFGELDNLSLEYVDSQMCSL